MVSKILAKWKESRMGKNSPPWVKDEPKEVGGNERGVISKKNKDNPKFMEAYKKESAEHAEEKDCSVCGDPHMGGGDKCPSCKKAEHMEEATGTFE